MYGMICRTSASNNAEQQSIGYACFWKLLCMRHKYVLHHKKPIKYFKLWEKIQNKHSNNYIMEWDRWRNSVCMRMPYNCERNPRKIKWKLSLKLPIVMVSSFLKWWHDRRFDKIGEWLNAFQWMKFPCIEYKVTESTFR